MLGPKHRIRRLNNSMKHPSIVQFCLMSVSHWVYFQLLQRTPTATCDLLEKRPIYDHIGFENIVFSEQAQKVRTKTNFRFQIVVILIKSIKSTTKNRLTDQANKRNKETKNNQITNPTMAPLSTFDNDRIVHPSNTIIIEEHAGECSMTTTTKMNQPLTSKPQRKQHKSISFNNIVKVRQSIHVLDYTDDEISACWYNDTEFDTIRANIAYELHLLQNGLLQESNECCRRGLESFSARLMAQRRKSASLSREAYVYFVLPAREFCD